MRALLCLVVLSLVLSVLQVSADVAVPYTSCSTSSTHLNVTSITANAYPPVKGSWFNVSVNGTLDEEVSSGKWSASGSFDGFPLPSSSGDISQFLPTPWQQGDIQFTDAISVRSTRTDTHQQSTREGRGTRWDSRSTGSLTRCSTPRCCCASLRCVACLSSCSSSYPSQYTASKAHNCSRCRALQLLSARSHSLVSVVCCAVLCCAVLCCAVLCCAVLCCAVLCCAVLCCAVLCWAVLCWAVLGCAGLCRAVMRCVTQAAITWCS